MGITKQALVCATGIGLVLATCMNSCTGCKRENDITGVNAQSFLHSHLDSLHIATDSIVDMDYNFQFLTSDGPVTDSINATISQWCLTGERETDVKNAITAAFAKENEGLVTELKEFCSPDDETYAHMRYQIIRQGLFDTDSPDSVLVYKASVYTYTGGAHGASIPLTLNFSLNTGRKVNLEDVINTSRQEEILALMQEKVIKDHGCTNREELMEKTGLLTLGELYLTDNFHMRKDSITFCFEQYEIAPYSSGITYISLALKDVK